MIQKNNPVISVVIPVKNNPLGLALLLGSLKRQTLSPQQFEVIVVDNGSIDQTKSVAQLFPVRLVSCSKPGSYAARNMGVKKSRGQHIAFIDSDCIAHPNWLKNGLKVLKQKQTSLVGGKIEFIFKNSTPSIFEYLDSANKLNQRGYVSSGFAATANMFVKKDIFKKHGYFREDFLSGGDYELGQRLTRAGEKLNYSSTAKVLHPARHSLRQIFKKTIRVSQGYKQLARLKLLRHHHLKLLSWLPILRVAQNQHYTKLGPFQKTTLVFLANLQKYLSLVLRTF